MYQISTLSIFGLYNQEQIIVVGAPSLEVFKLRLDGALSNLV